MTTTDPPVAGLMRVTESAMEFAAKHLRVLRVETRRSGRQAVASVPRSWARPVTGRCLAEAIGLMGVMADEVGA
ncbi:MAG: hypothetical protein IPI82_09145 [Candidatus Microthrix sp.]|nr:hypothetical protein [Candidatus Microthrix sp.]MBK7322604.1 hypothetical protein [Candidatus Microthrix sp.]